MIKQVEAAQQLCELLLWDSPVLAQKCFATFQHSIDSNDDCFDLAEALRKALRPILSYRDWDELDAMLDDLQRLANMRRLPIVLVTNNEDGTQELDDDDDDEPRFNTEDSDEFLAQVNDALVEDGYNLWSWETDSGVFCVFIAQAQDKDAIYNIVYTLGFTDDSGVAIRCCDVIG